MWFGKLEEERISFKKYCRQKKQHLYILKKLAMSIFVIFFYQSIKLLSCFFFFISFLHTMSCIFIIKKI